MNKILPLSVCFAMLISGCNQSRKLENALAFFKHITYGTIATDDKGNPLTPGSKTEGSIYLESKSTSKPEIREIIYYGDVINNPPVILIDQLPVNVGNKNSDNQPITLKPAVGNKLWKVEFSVPEKRSSDGIVNPAETKNASKLNIRIKGSQDGRLFTLSIKEAVELRAFMGL